MAIVISRFNADVTNRLFEGAREALSRCGVPDSDIEVRSVPGALEIPVVARALIDRGDFDAVVALGA